MKKHTSFVIAIILIMSFLISPLTGVFQVSAATASELTAQISSIGGLNASRAGNTVTVTGTAHSTVNIPLNIDAGVTVVWNAVLTGQASANNYLLTLSGSGIFEMRGGSITLTSGAGGTMYVAGAVTVNVNAGLIDSPGSGSALTLAAGVMGAVVNVAGGTVRSLPNGYAINDGAGMTASNNNTRINVSAGLVEAGAACAIRSTSIASVVTVTGGEVRNAATSNSNPVINMIYSPAPDNGLDNIIIQGGIVRTASTSNLSYILQSTQNILVSGGSVVSIAGRGINLIGTNSIARITGGSVITQSGTAVSTATTTLDDITNAQIIISGGVVEATGTGTAVKVTGYNSKVTVSGSAMVLAKTGLAIDASGRPAAGCVSVSGGLVLAWGNSVNKVVAPSGRLAANVGGYVTAWDTDDGTETYYQNRNTDLTLSAPAGGSAIWDNRPAGTGGIYFTGGNTDIFLPLNDKQRGDVTVINTMFTLTIVNGDGSTTGGVYEAGTRINVTARADTPVNTALPPTTNPVNGDKFRNWTSDAGGSFSDAGSRSTVFVMPGNNVTITANFGPRYLLHVDGLNGGITDSSQQNFGSHNYGYFAEGEVIIVSCSYMYSSAYFTGWQTTPGTYNGLIDNAQSLVTAFTMPGASVTLTAMATSTPRPAPLQYTTAIGDSTGIITSTTTGDAVDAPDRHKAMPGTGIRIEAAAPPAGRVFDRWVSSGGGGFINAGAANTVFIMPEEDVTITALYKPVAALYRLTVINGSDIAGSGYYHAGDLVEIIADIAPAGMRFAGWISNRGGDFDATDLRETVFHMPESDCVVTAHFEYAEFSLTIINGVDGNAGSSRAPGWYNSGEVVNIRADVIAGANFIGWVSDNGGSFGDVLAGETAFTMPAADVVLTALYSIYKVTVINSPRAGEISVFMVEIGETFKLSTAETPITQWVNPNDYPVNGNRFKGWASTDVTLSGADKINGAEFIMPQSNVTVVATFEPLYLLAIKDGMMAEGQSNGGFETDSGRFGGARNYGYFAAGDTISITADEAPWGTDDYWMSSGGSFADEHSRETVFTMPASAVVVWPSHVQPPNPDGRPAKYTTTVVSGVIVSSTNEGMLPEGTTVYEDYPGTGIHILAAPPVFGTEFSHWSSSGGGEFADAGSGETIFIMPEADVVITAHYVSNIIGSIPGPGQVPGQEPGQEPGPAPKSGVETYIVLAGCLLVVSAAGVILILRGLRKAKREDNPGASDESQKIDDINV